MWARRQSTGRNGREEGEGRLFSCEKMAAEAITPSAKAGITGAACAAAAERLCACNNAYLPLAKGRWVLAKTDGVISGK